MPVVGLKALSVRLDFAAFRHDAGGNLEAEARRAARDDSGFSGEAIGIQDHYCSIIRIMGALVGLLGISQDEFLDALPHAFSDIEITPGIRHQLVRTQELAGIPAAMPEPPRRRRCVAGRRRSR